MPIVYGNMSSRKSIRLNMYMKMRNLHKKLRRKDRRLSFLFSWRKMIKFIYLLSENLQRFTVYLLFINLYFKTESNIRLYIFYHKEETQMNKWVKSLTAMALASSLLMVGCSKGEDKNKEEDTTTQQEDKKDKETSGTEKSTDSKEKK